MNQLADDCFAFDGSLMRADEALAILHQRIAPVTDPETCFLAEGLNRILAQDLVAGADVPPHDNAAVDGFALRAGDLADGSPTVLRIVGRAAAGHPEAKPVGAGETIRIFTGAVMPDGADSVVMQEDIITDGDRITVPPGLKSGANRRRAGEDTKAGEVVLQAGKRLRPQDLALAASIGCGQLPVRQKLKVAIFSTGDELTEPGQKLSPGRIHDTNRYMLCSLLAKLGVASSDLGILPDDRAAVAEALSAAAVTHDLLITSGGVSMGEEDHVRTTVEALGNIHFWRLAIKPGRPLALGQIGSSAFIGLPGNPVAVMICFLRFARPLLLGLAGAAREDLEPRFYQLPSAFDFDKKADRREWLRVRLVDTGNGPRRIERFEKQGSGIINSLVQCDGLVEIGEDVTQIRVGELLDFLPFEEVMS
jgi:molybdopterin molybdotransferase